MLQYVSTSIRERHHRLLDGARVLDIAEGILISLRRCHSDAAFEELVSAAERHGIPIFALSFALVSLASGDVDLFEPDHGAQCAARCEWADLLD